MKSGLRPWLLAVVVGAVALAVVGVGLVASGFGTTPKAVGEEPVERVLVVSMPGVGWDDVDEHDMEHLAALADEGAVADISTRIGKRNARLPDAYLTMGAGTRSVRPSVDAAVAVDPEDQYGGVPTADLLDRRLGYVPAGIAYLASGAALDTNAESAFGGDVGLLGEVLADAGVARAVIANADAVEGFEREEEPADGYYQRSAATTLMGPDGIVPQGRVGRTLLVDDPQAPFGRRLDQDVVMDEFREVWEDNGPVVTLVEASDIRRAADYEFSATPDQADDLRAASLAGSDALLGRLLAEVDPERDAVIVVSPISPDPAPELGLVTMRVPGGDPGFLQSSTTRRDGYVHLADVAPTVATLMGTEFPSEVEGRSFQVSPRSGGSGEDRTSGLVEASEAAGFRDAFLPVFVTGLVVALVLLALAAAAHDRLTDRARQGVTFGSFVVLGSLSGTFLTGRVTAITHVSVLGHLVVVLAVGVAVAAAALALERRNRGTGALAAVGLLLGLLWLDALTGAVLQVNTLFGYSMAVAGRFAGLGNLALSLYATSAILLAALLSERYAARGRQAALVLMVVVVLVDGLPMFGPNVGGVVSMTPAFGVMLLVLAGRPVGWRQGAGLAVLTVSTVLVFALIDLARPAAYHSHLARFAEMVFNGQWQFIFTTFTRRWQASFGSLELAGWGTILVLLAVAVLHTWIQVRRSQGKGVWPAAVAPAEEQHTPTVAVLAGLAVFGTIGMVANDSSLAVPLMTLVVAVPVFVVRTMTRQQPDVELVARDVTTARLGE